ncbi:MAG TPA: 2-C-methyl-D-erythritol 4-phosphate cytidylyltransferase, partial [Puia sp.]
DGVRCLLSSDLVHRCHEQTIRLGSAIPVVDSKDSVRVMTGDDSVNVDRSRVKLVQTPQTFLSNVLLPAFAQPFRESFTDEASVIEAYGGKVCLVEGEGDNIKITTPIDLIMAEHILAARGSGM